MPFDLPVAIDGRVLSFTAALSITCGIAFGLVPAISATRAAFGESLKEGGRGASIGRAGRRWRSALIVSEVALAVTLLSSAGLLMRSFYRMQHTDPGFVTTNVLTAGLPIADAQFSDRLQMNAYLERIVARVQSLPGVARVALTDALPMHWPPYGTFFQIAGHARGRPRQSPDLRLQDGERLVFLDGGSRAAPRPAAERARSTRALRSPR